MHRPLQFSIRTMLGAMAVCCIAVGVLCWLHEHDPGPIIGLAAAYVVGNLAGIGVCHLIRKPELGAIFSGAFAVAAVFVYVAWVIMFAPW